jgi:gamma-glutamylcyclotransferase (GGCT)/AIG2-like uncharacterized protein YtfP
VNYFAYGSNMSLQRLQARVASARPLGTAILPEHSLRFHKAGRDGSAKCDALHTSDLADAIHGVLFHIDSAGKSVLDRVEGLGAGYEEKQVTLACGTRAVTYVATHIDESLLPFHWYKRHVLVGAREAFLPTDYVMAIDLHPAVEDPDLMRHARESAIHD